MPELKVAQVIQLFVGIEIIVFSLLVAAAFLVIKSDEVTIRRTETERDYSSNRSRVGQSNGQTSAKKIKDFLLE